MTDSRPRFDGVSAGVVAAVSLAAVLPFVPGLSASQWLSRVAVPASSWGFDGGLFMPLAWLSRKAGHEWVVNAFLHAAASGLVFLAALLFADGLRLRGRRPALLCASAAALLFGLSPLRGAVVLSDAGRPALLSSIFLLGSLLAYLRYRDADEGLPWLWAALLAYAAACLSWTGAAAFPLLLAALDSWFPGRPGRARWPNPLAVPSWAAVSFALVAYVAVVYAMNGHYLSGPARIPHWSAGFELRRLGAGLAQCAGQLLWPRPVGPFEPVLPAAGQGLCLAAALGLTALALWRSRGAGAWLAACLALYASAFFAAWDPAAIVAQTDAARAGYLPTAFLLAAGAPLAASWLETAALPVKRAGSGAAALLVALAAGASMRASLALRREAPGLAQAEQEAAYEAADALARSGALTSEDAPVLGSLADGADLDGAIRLLKLASDAGGDVASARVNLALRLNSAGRVDEAVAQLQEAVRENPSLVVARNDLGFFLIQRGRYQEAIEQLKEAVRLDPGMALAQNNLAAAQAAQAGKIPLAERTARSQRLLNQAVQDAGRGRAPQAIEELGQAAVLDPGNSWIPFDLGVIEVQAGRVAEAEGAFRRAVAIAPNSSQAHFNLGFTLHQQGRLDEAVAEYREAIRCDPRAANAYLNAGVALTAQNKLAEADQFCSQAARLDPGAANNPHCYRKR